MKAKNLIKYRKYISDYIENHCNIQYFDDIELETTEILPNETRQEYSDRIKCEHKEFTIVNVWMESKECNRCWCYFSNS